MIVTAIREMTIDDYEQMIALWHKIDGLALSEADTKNNIDSYLQRNKGLSYICEDNNTIIGTILCGHDGRRGFIYHVAVKPEFRHRQIGIRLVERSLFNLRRDGINKCHIFVIEDNSIGNSFWSSAGWEKRSGFFIYSKST
jgi:ribosomal protein S18 acetylase RimI-like enzyme